MSDAGPRQAATLPVRTVLVGGLLLFSVLPAAVVGWLLYQSNLHTAQLLADTTIDSVGQRVRSDTEGHLAQAHRVLNGLVDAQPAGAAALHGRQLVLQPEWFEQAAFRLTRLTPDVPGLVLGTAQGAQLGVETLLQGGHQTVRIDERQAGSAASRRYLADTPGDRRHPVRGSSATDDPRNAPWYQTAMLTRGRAFTAVGLSADGQELGLALSQPVFAADGSVLGVVAALLPLKRLGDLLHSLPISRHGIAFLVDEQGFLVATSTGEPVILAAGSQWLRRQPQQSGDPTLRAAYAEVASSMGQKREATGQRIAFLRRVPQGDSTLLVALLPFGEDLGVRWSLVVAAPQTDFTAGAQGALEHALAAASLVLLLGVALSVALAWRLGRHVERLGEAAALLAVGGMPARQASCIAEIDQLWQVLHRSAVQLEHYRADTAAQTLALHTAQDRLSARIALRNAELSASRDEALDAARAKAAFLATMSHEIRTPLNGVVGMATLLADTRLDPQQRDYLHTMRRSSDQLLAVVSDILDFSKIESGRLQLECELLDLPATIKQACTADVLRAREKGIRLHLDLADDLPAWVRGDAARLRQVLRNLVGNAVKFTASGQVTVTARLLQASVPTGPGALVEFRIRDTGIGIAPEHQAVLFQPFVQVDGGTTRQYGGAGLGLAICQLLATLMGGQVGLESALEHGSTFWFTARLETASPPDADALAAQAALAAAADAPPARPAAAGRQTVLVVDDNATNLKVALAMLARLGYAAATAVNGREAVERVAASLRPSPDAGRAGAAVDKGNAPQPYAAVLMDTNMPVLDGVDATRLILASHGAAAPPVIALTASVLREDRRRCLQSGMVAFLPKPLDLGALADALARHALPSTAVDAIKIVANYGTGHTETGQNIQNLQPLPIDWSRLEQFREIDDDGRSMTRALVDLFTGEMPQRTGDIYRALASGDSAALSRSAHALKGAASNVGANALSLGCGLLEQSCLHGQWPTDACAQVERIDQDAALACTLLHGWMDRQSKSQRPGGA